MPCFGYFYDQPLLSSVGTSWMSFGLVRICHSEKDLTRGMYLRTHIFFSRTSYIHMSVSDSCTHDYVFTFGAQTWISMTFAFGSHRLAFVSTLNAEVRWDRSTEVKGRKEINAHIYLSCKTRYGFSAILLNSHICGSLSSIPNVDIGKWKCSPSSNEVSYNNPELVSFHLLFGNE